MFVVGLLILLGGGILLVWMGLFCLILLWCLFGDIVIGVI